MKVYNINNFKDGWFIGNFEPTVWHTGHFEVSYKTFEKGQTESKHYQKKSKELTLLIEGSCRIGSQILKPGDILEIDANEIADFEAYDNCKLIAIKCPSIPDDKYLA